MPIQLSKNDIRAIYHQGEDAVVSLVEMLMAKINFLEAEIEKLKAQLTKDSHNSSKPPSSDYHRPKPKSQRKKSSKHKGGQKGHKGHTLKQVETPDHIVVHPLTGKGACGCNLEDARFLRYEKRQVFDIPPVEMEVTEHLGEVKQCNCGICHTAQFPPGVTAPVQYGERIHATMVYLSTYQLLPQKRTTEVMADLFDVHLSEGTLNTSITHAYKRLAETEEAIKDALVNAPVIHADETGIYIGGKRLWEHTCGTDSFTYYYFHQGRGFDAIEAGKILVKYAGRVVHDGWPSYFKFDILHALCNAHHIRELVFIAEQFRQQWASDMITLLCHIKTVVDRARGADCHQLDPRTLNRYEKIYDKIITRGYDTNPVPDTKKKRKKRGRKKQTPPRNLLDRLHIYKDETLAFMYDFNVPFDNNTSGRDLRMTKVKQKISGCFRSEKGARAFCRIRGFISTLMKQGHNVMESLINCFDHSCTQSNLLPLMK